MNLLIKPASSLCNLRCRYCFYEDVAEQRAQKSYGMMSMETAQAVVARLFERPRRQVVIGFQGGEPTLAGLDFFREFVGLVQARNVAHVPVAYSIQTNGYCLDDGWAEFFARHRFLVGISCDGPAKEHNALRVDPQGRGTFQAVMNGISCLERHQVPFNILCVVTGFTARHGQKLYRFFRSRGCRYLQFIPCLDPLEAARGGMAYSLTPEKYAAFLCNVFDCWYQDWKAGDYTSVRLFDDYVHLLCGRPAGTCASSGACGQYFVVEADGSVYPCDFYVLDRWKLGQVQHSGFDEMAASERAQAFLREGRQPSQGCAGCEYYAVCRGGCKRDKVAEQGWGNYHCAAFRAFFQYAMPRLREIAAAERRYRR